ncbi:MAG: hypothetical protein ACO36I_19055, partial [Candidatus Latescibacterota bacterium]
MQESILEFFRKINKVTEPWNETISGVFYAIVALAALLVIYKVSMQLITKAMLRQKLTNAQIRQF